MAHWLFVSARYYTRQIRGHLRDGNGIMTGWSCPKTLKPLDQVLVYEMGKPGLRGDPPGRKQIGWLLQAISEPEHNGEWDWIADFRGMPIAHPLPLADAKKDITFREWRGGSLQGSRGSLSVPKPVWNVVISRLDKTNPGLKDRLSTTSEISLEPTEVDPSEVSSIGFDRQGWLRERFLQDDVADLIQADRWGTRPDPRQLGLAEPGEHGYYLQHERWFVDDLVLIGPRHLLVIEYELHASGDPMHGAQQAYDYARALRPTLRGWTIDAAVIAQSFAQRELNVADRLGVECLEASPEDGNGIVLRHLGNRGAAWDAIQRARTRRRRA